MSSSAIDAAAVMRNVASCNPAPVPSTSLITELLLRASNMLQILCSDVLSLRIISLFLTKRVQIVELCSSMWCDSNIRLEVCLHHWLYTGLLQFTQQSIQLVS